LLTLVNGKKTDKVSAFDRGLLYGQSVFETVCVNNTKPCLLDKHVSRLASGATVIGIEADIALIVDEVEQLAKTMLKGVIRITLSTGEGGRGYQNPQQLSPTRIISQHEYPSYAQENWEQGIELGLAEIRLARQPALAGFKHGNRLEQTIARSQWENSWQEALLLDTDNNVIEGTQSNVFLIKDQCLITPSLDQAGVNGIMRQTIIELANQNSITLKICSVSLDDIKQADDVFMTNSVIGLWPVKRFFEVSYKRLNLTDKLLKEIIKNEFIPNI